MSDVTSAAPAAAAPTTSNAPATPKAGSPPTGSADPATKSQTAAPTGGASTQTSTPNSKFAESTQPPAAGEQTETKQAERRKYKLKVDGAEQELELADDEISVRLQKAMAAEKRMQEAAELRKQYERFVEQVKADPVAALKDPRFGIDVRKQIEDQLIAEWEQQQKLQGLTPAEREAVQRAEAAERKAAELEAREAKRQQEIQQRQQQELETKVQADLEREFMEALDKSNLPKNRQTLALMAEIAALNLEHGIELTRDQLVAETNERLRGMQKHVMGGLKGDALVKYLGDDVVREVIRHSVSVVRGQPQSAKTFESPVQPNAPQQTFVDDDDKPKNTKRDSQGIKDIRKFFRG